MNIKFGDSSLNLKVDGSLANIDRGPRGYSAYEIAVQEGFVGTEEEWLASLVGPEGKQGKDGERGIQGPRGQQGDKGDKGDKGDTGSQGETGATGPSNVLSIGSVTKGDEANATITGESPNQILNLVLPKGDKGDTGSQGETGATGNGILSIQKTATAGLVDTYTTTFTDGTTTTFDVTNGEDGEVTQKQLDETNGNVSWLQTLTEQMSHVAGQGTDLSLGDVLNYRLMKFLPQGVSKQFSTKGYQLIDFGTLQPYPLNTTIVTFEDNILAVSNPTAYAYARATTNITEVIKSNPNKSVRFGYDSLDKSESATVQLVIRYNDGTATKYISLLNNYFLVPDNTDIISSVEIGVYTNNSSTASVGNITITKPILYFGDTKPEYETYTGGMPAPNPSYSIMPSRVTGENSLILQNENFFDKNSSLITNNKRISTSTGGSYSSNGYSISPFIEVKPDTQYNLTSGIQSYYCWYDENEQKISGGTWNTGESKTSPSNVKYVKFDFQTSNIDTIMFVKGSTAPTTYVEHEEQNYPITLKSDNLIGLDTAQYPVDLKVGDKVTFKNQTSANLQLQFFTNYGDETRNDFWSINPGITRTITVAKNSKAISWNKAILSGLAWANKGETLQGYHPYTENPIELNSSSDGTIRDGIVGKPNEWYKREYIGKVVLDGSESYSRASSSSTRIAYETNIANIISYTNPSDVPDLISNRFTSVSYNASWKIGNISRWTNRYSLVLIVDPSISTISDFKTWLSQNNVTVWYQKSQYTDIPITDTTLINQLNDIYNNAHSYNGVTNITTTYEDGNEQMYLDIEALAKSGSTTAETDPIFSASASSGITSSDISNWNNKADVEDIPDLTDYVKNTDYASSSKGGVFKTGWYNLQMERGGHPYAINRSYNDYLGDNNLAFISKGTLENVITGKNLADKNYVDTAIATAITNTLGGSF